MLASVQSTGQSANTASGVTCIKSYIQGKKWDVILINFGIHDTWEHQYVSPEQYGKNLQYIFREGLAGLAPHGKLIWSTTTPISSNCTGCGGELYSNSMHASIYSCPG
eukprot:COSAG01_NODE_1005_length_12174_cov_40.917267_11_plen_108_part_00